MRTPADMEVIQIEITNACLHACSNCTRFCGHHKHPFYMDWPTYRRAVDSLAGFEGIIGLMGGEPTLHPQFERMTRYLADRHPMPANLKATRRPVRDFLAYTRAKHNANRVISKCRGPGLFSSMPRQYYRYYELIQDTFVFQGLNDHCNPSFHQPLLIARRDLGVPDDTWHTLRDACWIQNCWSASITPKGAFFCEMAGALDLLFDGPGGWPIEPGWWRRTPAEFEDQLHWCELCGAALPTTRRNANDQQDDVSPTLRRRLKAIDSPGLRRGRVVDYRPHSGPSEAEWQTFQRSQYIADYAQRLGATNRNLLPRAFNGLVLVESDATATDVGRTLKSMHPQLQQVVLLGPRAARYAAELAFPESATLRAIPQPPSGLELIRALRWFNARDWVLVATAGQLLPPDVKALLSETFLNPGMLYHFTPAPHTAPEAPADPWQAGFFLFHQKASSLIEAGFDGAAHCLDWYAFQKLWSADRRIAVTTPPPQWPEIDETEWMARVDQNVLADTDFCHQFSLIMSQGAPRSGNILITQSASFYLTHALTRLLLKLQYAVYLITHARFRSYFEDLLPPDQMLVFDQGDMITRAALQKPCQALKERIAFAGAVVPYSTPHRLVVPEDGYQEIEQVAEFTAGRILCRVNLKRQFVTGHANHLTRHDNRWRY